MRESVGGKEMVKDTVDYIFEKIDEIRRENNNECKFFRNEI